MELNFKLLILRWCKVYYLKTEDYSCALHFTFSLFVSTINDVHLFIKESWKLFIMTFKKNLFATFKSETGQYWLDKYYSTVTLSSNSKNNVNKVAVAWGCCDGVPYLHAFNGADPGSLAVDLLVLPHRLILVRCNLSLGGTDDHMTICLHPLEDHLTVV